MLRRSPRVVLPQISGNSRPADSGGLLSILGGGTSRAWAAGTDALPRRSLPALYCCPYRRQQSGGFRRAASYIGQIVRGQWVQTFCRVALPASFCCQYTATAIQRSRPTPCTTAKLCYCKSCVTAFGGWPRASRAWQRAQMLCCAALPASFCHRVYTTAAGRRISEAGWLYWGTSRARAAGTDVPLRRSPPRCTAAAYIPGATAVRRFSEVAPYTAHCR